LTQENALKAPLLNDLKILFVLRAQNARLLSVQSGGDDDSVSRFEMSRQARAAGKRMNRDGQDGQDKADTDFKFEISVII
jgi:hypothetical protein